jgi:adenosyl cobinamide kinase/adenosyl cobinamide phosphate guanylyltransferase
VGLSLLIGGARAGKSSLAARLAHKTGLPVTFVATAKAGDEEMKQRIARHRAERPAEWTTLEEPVTLARAIDCAGPEDTVIVDCLTLWVSNLILAAHDDEEVQARAEAAAAQAAGRAGRTLVVTNEVGLGVHPNSDLGRRFRDLLGRVNAIWADQAEEVLLVVAGRALTLKPLELC